MKWNKKAYKIVENSKNFFISVVTYIELVQGMRNKNELDNLRRALHKMKNLFCSEKPGPLGQVRVNRLCQRHFKLVIFRKAAPSRGEPKPGPLGPDVYLAAGERRKTQKIYRHAPRREALTHVRTPTR